MQGIVDGEPVIVVEHDTRIHDYAAPDWPHCRGGDNCYRVLLEGRPKLTCELDMEDEHGGDGGLIACSMRVVNAIPAVLRRARGLTLDARPADGLRAQPIPLGATPDHHQALDFYALICDDRLPDPSRPRTSVRTCGMGKVHELGYVGIASLDLDAWSAYTTGVLGHEVAHDSDAESLFLKMDGHHHRLSVHPGETEDVAFVGWEVGSAENMQALAAQLDAADVEVTAATRAEAGDRRVVDFVHFVDPHSGCAWSCTTGPKSRSCRRSPSTAVTGFKTGNQGIGHFVTFVPDPVAAAMFYERSLGFAVSDWIIIPGMGRIGAFMHCNTRHHSLAFFAEPPAPQAYAPRDDGVHVDRRRRHRLRPLPRARPGDGDARSSPQ